MADSATAVLAVSVLGAILLSTFGCYYFLYRNKRMLSKRTQDLYRRLVNALLLDLGICFLLILAPFIVWYTCVKAQSPYTSVVYSVAFTTAALYQIVTHVVLLTYITPYRRAVLGVYLRATGRSEQGSSEASPPSMTTSRTLFRPRTVVK